MDGNNTQYLPARTRTHTHTLPFPSHYLRPFLVWENLVVPCRFIRRMEAPRVMERYMWEPGIIFSKLGRPAACSSAVGTHCARLLASQVETWWWYALPFFPLGTFLPFRFLV